jgi:hypothetical protein
MDYTSRKSFLSQKIHYLTAVFFWFRSSNLLTFQPDLLLSTSEHITYWNSSFSPHPHPHIATLCPSKFFPNSFVLET